MRTRIRIINRMVPIPILMARSYPGCGRRRCRRMDGSQGTG
jgi:hypothetical protein